MKRSPPNPPAMQSPGHSAQRFALRCPGRGPGTCISSRFPGDRTLGQEWDPSPSPQRERLGRDSEPAFPGHRLRGRAGLGPSAGHPAAALWPEPQDPDPAASLHGGGDRGPPGRQHRLLAEACPAPDLAAPAQPGAALSLPTAPVDHVLAPITTQPARRSRPLRAAL